MEQWREELYHSELYHHGVKGMKWGVRRYQNYDGSYTQAGLKRYKAANDTTNRAYANSDSKRSAYKAAKKKYKDDLNAYESQSNRTLKGIKNLARNKKYSNEDYEKLMASKQAMKDARADYKESKNLVKQAKRNEKNEYRRLENDYQADKGKELYQQGKTVEDIRRKSRLRAVGNLGITVATLYAEHGVNFVNGTNIAQIKLDRKAGRMIRNGATAVHLALSAKENSDVRKLRSYYAHSSSNGSRTKELNAKLGGGVVGDLKKSAKKGIASVKKIGSDFKQGFNEGMAEVRAEQQRQNMNFAQQQSMQGAEWARQEAERASRQAASLSMTNGMNPFMFGGSTASNKKPGRGVSANSGAVSAKAKLAYMQSSEKAKTINGSKKKSASGKSDLAVAFDRAKKDNPSLTYDKIYKEMKVNMNSEDPDVYRKAEDEWLKKHGYRR